MLKKIILFSAFPVLIIICFGIYKGIEYKKTQDIIKAENERKAAEAERAWKNLNRVACEKLFEKCKIECTPSEEKQLVDVCFSFEQTKSLLISMCDERIQYWSNRLDKVNEGKRELNGLMGRYAQANGGIISRYDTSFNDAIFELKGYEDKAKEQLGMFKKQRIIIEQAKITDEL